MPLIRFGTPVEGEKDFGEPPKEILARSEWIANILATELHQAMQDPGIQGRDRYDLIFKFSRAMTQAMPNHEIFAAKESVRSDEQEVNRKKLGGEISRVKTTGTGPLRANAPRRQKK